jgi:hypothetical protein
MAIKKQKYIDFAFDPQESSHHFIVNIPKENTAPVRIEEHFDWNNVESTSPIKGSKIKVILDRYRWERIAEPARKQFIKRMRAAGLRPQSWRQGEATLLAPHFGRELTLLGWAIEDIDESLIPNAIANWLGLEQEERWWLYTTVNATFVKPEIGRDRGWRKAIKIAFSENPIPEIPQERFIEAQEAEYLQKREQAAISLKVKEEKVPFKKKKTRASTQQRGLFDDA